MDLHQARSKLSGLTLGNDEGDAFNSVVPPQRVDPPLETGATKSRPLLKKTSTLSVSNHTTGTSGTHISFVEHQVRRERGNSSADEASLLNASIDDTAPPAVSLLPSVSFPGNEEEFPAVGQPSEEEEEADDSSLVPADQERQLILLMLLAQVCALHDPTPRTFTVHVLELFERGILDRQSIHFLYDLGLVPATTNFTSSSTSPSSSSRLLLEQSMDAENVTAQSDGNDVNDDRNATLTLMERGTTQQRLNLLRQRSLEASAIRTTLEYHEQQSQLLKRTGPSGASSTSHSNPSTSIPCPTADPPERPQAPQASWSVDQHPLSLSRYQREFDPIELLASGSFGHVYRVRHKMDGREYAVKRVSFAAAGYSRDAVQQVVREVQCLAACDHPHVVRYYTSWLEPSWMTGSNNTANQFSNIEDGDACGSSSVPNDESGSNKEHLEMLSDLQRMIASGGDSSQELSNNLKSYFRDPSFRRRAISSRQSSWSSDDDDSPCSSWGDGLQECSEWTVEESIPDANTHSHEQRILTRHRMRHNAGDARAQQTTLSKYQYQVSLYIQMQLCCPATLADWIRSRNQKMSDSSIGSRLEKVALIFTQIVDGLCHVHAVKIVHRDIKPSNVFAGADGLHFKLGDFGLSKIVESSPNRSAEMSASPTGMGDNQGRQQLLLLEHHHRTEDERAPNYRESSFWQDPHTAGVGTASYAAPEQVQSQTYGTPADIFSLGLILLELLCCFSTEHERLQTFHDCRHRRTLPPEFANYPLESRVILACTEPNAAQRPTARELKALAFKPYPVPTQNVDTVAILQQKLLEKERQLAQCRQDLAEKDKIIDELQAKCQHLESES